MSGILEKRAYSVAEVATMLGLAKPTLHLALKRGELPSFKLGGKVLVPRVAVDALLKGGEATANNAAAAD